MKKLLIILLLPFFIFATKYGKVKLWDGTNDVIVSEKGELYVSVDGHVDTLNSTSTPLDSGDTFTGETFDISDAAVILVSVYSDKASATDGLIISFSTDSVNFDNEDFYTIAALTGKTYSFQPSAKYYRVQYINGDTTQTEFRLQTILKRTYIKPSSHRIADNVSGEDDAELVKSVITGKDENGIYINQRVNSAGVSLTSDFLLEVAKGNVEGHSFINKFGHNPAADSGEDIWGGGGLYSFYPDTAESMSITSTVAGDDSGSTGAWEVVVYGLDSNWLEINEMVTLSGVDTVALSNLYVRVFRAVVHTAGATGFNEGIITVFDTSGSIGAYINIDDGQTQQAIYTIPGNKTGYFIKGYVALANTNKNGEDGEFQWLMRQRNSGNGAWNVQGQVGLVNIGSSFWIYEYGVPAGPIPPMTDMRIRQSDASATMNSTAGYDLLLIEN